MTNVFKANFDAEIAELVAQRKKWELGTYASSNTELYAILARCLELYQQAAKEPHVADAIKDVLKGLGIKGNSGTSLATKVVRIVFATPATYTKIKQRLYGYARVIAVAHAEDQTPQTLAAFIEHKGGIDEIRRASSTTPANAPEAIQSIAKAEFAKADRPTLYDAFELKPELMPADGERYSLALVRKNADGTGSIIFGTKKASIVNSVLTEAGKALQSTAAKVAVSDLHQSAEDQKRANLAALSKKMLQPSAPAVVEAEQAPAVETAQETPEPAFA
ncbi:hypothetical protein [Pseudorhodobacter ferrugineus]|uniref:hypothetical protein n=1 Tax=Pseudorhodobacter ferrugineus TaxID=77008 RepID=UPI0004118CE4|nr:hypothetical protein [Pseudorhodobacter ferrugineus]